MLDRALNFLFEDSKCEIFSALGIFKKKKHYLQKYFYMLAVGIDLQPLNIPSEDLEALIKEMSNELYSA